MTRTQKEIDKLLDRMIVEAEKNLDKAFAERLKDILAQIAAMYEKYSKNGELSITELNKYNRFAEEMALITEQMTDHYKYIMPMIQELMENTFLENYLRSAFLYEYEAQISMGFTVPSAKLIKAAIRNPIPKLTLPEIMKEHRNQIVRDINIEISQSLLAGEDYSRMAKRITKVVDFSRAKARRVARTEAGRVRSEARIASGEQASKFAKLDKVWSATLDERTRSSHRKLDGRKADKDGYFHHQGLKAKGPHLFFNASQDVNCRCSVIYLVNGEYPEVRRARVEGKNVVIPYQSYEDWEKTLGKAG
ncbi:phage minor head protein [Terribacillus sp. 179-K 1B1 HS]|uniref:phage minor head protein n=1 Tax=Terribacillus sp. 179-K 1B1 HS TaxID=3142388 RepID=UPI0039A330D8